MAIITIGGNVGAGKTTLASKLAKALRYEELYIGGIFRDLAASRGISIEEFYSQMNDNPELERSIDERQKALMEDKDDIVVQGRMTWLFAKSSPFTTFNIFLAVSPKVGAERSQLRKENKNKTIEDIISANAFRTETEIDRYKSLYDVPNFLDAGHYDFVLDTTNLSESEVFNKILAKLKERIEEDL